MTTALIDEVGLGSVPPDPDAHRLVAAALTLAQARETAHAGSPWYARPGWRVGESAAVAVTLVDDDARGSVVRTTGVASSGTAQVSHGAVLPASLVAAADHVVVTVGDRTRSYVVAVDDHDRETVVWVGAHGDAHAYRVPVRHRIARPGDDEAPGGELRSPMPGSVVVLPRAAGDPVRAGDVVAVVEAMKMEYPLVSPRDGVLESVHVALGDQVVRDQVVAVVRVEEGQS
jgi:acetyl-CoA/propionyl-CoA carboxylase, biotin carboxylase, biotin carboxyl carrier protein